MEQELSILQAAIIQLREHMEQLEMRLDMLEQRPKTCSCKCHKPGGQKFMRREIDTFSVNLQHIAVPCCDCPLVLL